MLHLLIDLLIGAAADLIAGLLGTGNSLVVLPGLIFLFFPVWVTDASCLAVSSGHQVGKKMFAVLLIIAGIASLYE